MIPDDFITIPTALKHIRSRIDEDDLSVIRGHDPAKAARESLESELLRSQWAGLSLYVMRGGTAAEIPYEDTKQLIMDGGWDEAGRAKGSPKYDGCRLLIRRFELGQWLGPPPGESFYWSPPKESDVSAVPKTGAPGRPSSMPIVIAEFERRRAHGQCEQSRWAEADALAVWLKKTHPEQPVPTSKTIANKLPQDFQPYSGRSPKL